MQLGDGLRRWREKRAADTLDAALRVAAPGADDGHRLQINGDVLVGDAVAALVGLTEQADMMVVGAHGKTTLRLGPIGSIAAEVVQHAHCPVAVIPDEHSALQRPARAPVLVGIDVSLASQPAVAIAFEEASRRRVGLIAVYSCRDREMAGIDDPKPAAPKIVASQTLAEHLAPLAAALPARSCAPHHRHRRRHWPTAQGVRIRTAGHRGPPRSQRVAQHPAGVGGPGGSPRRRQTGHHRRSAVTAPTAAKTCGIATSRRSTGSNRRAAKRENQSTRLSRY